MSNLPPNFRIIDLTFEQYDQLRQDYLQTIVKSIAEMKTSIHTQKINLEQLCEIYKWPKPTVYGWVSKRYIPHYKVGKELIFYFDEIETWIKKHRVKTNEEIEESL